MHIQFDPAIPAGTTITLPLTADLSLDLCWCPPGGFLMGEGTGTKINEKVIESANYLPSYRVTLTQGFWIGRFPITQDIGKWIWREVYGQGPGYNFYINESTDKAPLDGISWSMARGLFCNYMTHLLHDNGILQSNQRIDLPTQAQWEYACRAGSSTIWHFGNDATKLRDFAWYRDDIDQFKHSTVAVGQKLPNAWSLHDVYGNVDEWCLDMPYDHKTPQQLVDPLFFVEDALLSICYRGGHYNTSFYGCNSISGGSFDPYDEAGFVPHIGMRIVCISEPDNRISDVLNVRWNERTNKLDRVNP